MIVKIVNENGTDFLTIKMPIVKQPSKTGKTMLVACTAGFKETDAIVDGKPVAISLNACIRK